MQPSDELKRLAYALIVRLAKMLDGRRTIDGVADHELYDLLNWVGIDDAEIDRMARKAEKDV